MDAVTRPFARLAAHPEPPLAELSLAIAGAFRHAPADDEAILARIDALAGEVRGLVEGSGGLPAAEAMALAQVLGGQHGYRGDEDDYDAPVNSFLDCVVRRGRGLPILLSVLWLTVAERAGIDLAGVGLPGHFVVAHVGATPPLVLDPFRGGEPFGGPVPSSLPLVTTHDIALRMLSNLVASYERRHDPGRALRAAEMRLLLPVDARLQEGLDIEARRLAALFN